MNKLMLSAILAATILITGMLPAYVTATFESPNVPIAIDIKPGSDPNSINTKSKGTIPVAMLTDAHFNATTVDETSLTFGRTGSEHSLKFCTKSFEDVDGDSDLDKVCHFDTQKARFQVGDTTGMLMGDTFTGTHFHGTDSVMIVK